MTEIENQTYIAARLNRHPDHHRWLEQFITWGDDHNVEHAIQFQPTAGIFVRFREELFPHKNTLTHQESANQRVGHIYFIHHINTVGTIYAVPVKVRPDGRTLEGAQHGSIVLTKTMAQNLDHKTAPPAWYIAQVFDMKPFIAGADAIFDAQLLERLIPSTVIFESFS